MNKINNKQYVGKTNLTIDKRFKEHVRDSKRNRCNKRPLYDAMNKYGIENFYIEILEECEVEKASEREKYWIYKLGTFHYGYNMTTGGDGKVFYNHKEIAEAYSLLKDTKKVCEKFGCCPDIVRLSCKENDIEMISPPDIMKDRLFIPVVMIKDNEEKVFYSLSDACRFLVDNGYTSNKSIPSIRKGIVNSCKNINRTAYGFKWRYYNP